MIDIKLILHKYKQNNIYNIICVCIFTLHYIKSFI